MYRRPAAESYLSTLATTMPYWVPETLTSLPAFVAPVAYVKRSFTAHAV